MTDVLLDGDSIRVRLKNAGESYARYLSASISYPLPPNGSKLVDSGAFDLNMEMSPRSRDVPKQSAYALTLAAPNGTFETLFGMKPVSVRKARDNERHSQAAGGVLIGGSLLLTINYADSLQTQRKVSEILYLMQNAAPGERIARLIILSSETTRIVSGRPTLGKHAITASDPTPGSSPTR